MAEGPNPFTAVKGEDYLEVLTNYYKTSLEKLKSMGSFKCRSVIGHEKNDGQSNVRGV
ncbi:hypothetical protein GCM10020331_095430 [Ectobacillus funiculus]